MVGIFAFSHAHSHGGAKCDHSKPDGHFGHGHDTLHPHGDHGHSHNNHQHSHKKSKGTTNMQGKTTSLFVCLLKMFLILFSMFIIVLSVNATFPLPILMLYTEINNICIRLRRCERITNICCCFSSKQQSKFSSI